MKTIKNKINVLVSSLAIVAGMMSFCGCSSNDDDLAGGKNVATEQGGEEMKFSAKVGTRLNEGAYVFTGVNAQFQSGDSVRLWVDDCRTTDMDMTTAPTAHAGYTVFSVNTSNNTLTQRRGATLKYPTSGNRVNIYAMRVNAQSSISDGAVLPTSTGIRHSVMTDQTTSANYCKSDLLYGELKYQKHTSSTVAIPFKHALTKISVMVDTDNPEEFFDFTNAKIEILDTQTEGLVTLNRNNGFGISSLIVTPTGSTHTIEATHDLDYANSVVMIPQTIKASVPFIRVTSGMTGHSFTFRLSNTTTFEPGKEYIYNIVTNVDIINDISTIEVTKVVDWVNTDIDATANGYKK